MQAPTNYPDNLGASSSIVPLRTLKANDCMDRSQDSELGTIEHLPMVQQLLHLDIYRDGGSLSATFVGNDERTYCLFFQIRSIGLRAFTRATLTTWLPNDYTSPVTGHTYKDWKELSRDVSWAESRTILAQLDPLVDECDSQSLRIFRDMKQATHQNVTIEPSRG